LACTCDNGNRLLLCLLCYALRAVALLNAYAYTDKPEYLYEPTGSDGPTKAQGRKLSMRRLAVPLVSESPQEVQCEA
jgi:hypothetical protein